MIHNKFRLTMIHLAYSPPISGERCNDYSGRESLPRELITFPYNQLLNFIPGSDPDDHLHLDPRTFPRVYT